jgi:hypothetical protein
LNEKISVRCWGRRSACGLGDFPRIAAVHGVAPWRWCRQDDRPADPGGKNITLVGGNGDGQTHFRRQNCRDGCQWLAKVVMNVRGVGRRTSVPGGSAINGREIEIEIEQTRARLAANEVERRALDAVLKELLSRRTTRSLETPHALIVAEATMLTAASSSADKIALFRNLFAGRHDVFPVRWAHRKTTKSGYAPACANEWDRGICGKPQVKCGECPHQAFIPVTDDIIEKHLCGGSGARASDGDFVAGVYPLLTDETCWFLAADFDEENWAADALAMLETCRAKGVPAALERSRSGNGGHLWIFFSEPVPARTARQLGAAMLTETMERRPEIGFASYDRFFPSQHNMPVGGFGNLIALPLQRRARELGNSVFIDADLRPYEDQWAFLAAIPRLSANAAAEVVGDAEMRGRVLGVRMPVEDEDEDEPWRMTPSRRPKGGPLG